MVKTKTTGSVKKSITKKNNITASQDYINRNGVEAFGKLFESIKHTAPAYEPDQEALSLAIRAELAVVEAEKEKEAKLPNMNAYNRRLKCFVKEKYHKGYIESCENVHNWYTEYAVKEKIRNYVTITAILSLLVGYTASFIIKTL